MEPKTYFVMVKPVDDSHWVIVTPQLPTFAEAKKVYDEMIYLEKPLYDFVKIGETIYG